MKAGPRKPWDVRPQPCRWLGASETTSALGWFSRPNVEMPLIPRSLGRMLPEAQGGAGVLDCRERTTLCQPVSRQSDCSLSTTFLLIRLFFTRAVLIKGPLSTRNTCSGVLLCLLMMPGIIKSGRNFQHRELGPPPPPPTPRSSAFSPSPPSSARYPLETDLGKQSVQVTVRV